MCRGGTVYAKTIFFCPGCSAPVSMGSHIMQAEAGRCELGGKFAQYLVQGLLEYYNVTYCCTSTSNQQTTLNCKRLVLTCFVQTRPGLSAHFCNLNYMSRSLSCSVFTQENLQGELQARDPTDDDRGIPCLDEQQAQHTSCMPCVLW